MASPNSSEWARLQATLRAIERGERLESIDELLIRQVLHQAPPKPAGTASFRNSSSSEPNDAIQGSDAYRVLLQLRKQKQQKLHQENVKKKATQEAEADHQQHEKHKSPEKSPDKKQVSPRRATSTSPTKQHSTTTSTRWDDDERQRSGNAEEDAQATFALYRQQMKQSLANTQQQLQQSQQELHDEQQKLDNLVAASQSILSSKFLFAKNLTDFCQERSIKVIQNVLQRMKHRFYKLYFHRWVDVTDWLRLLQQQHAVATIVRVFRGHRARKLRFLLHKEAQKFHKQATQVVSLRVTYRTHQALKIQRIWRRFQWKKAEKRRQQVKKATVYLQIKWKDRQIRKNTLVAALLNVKTIRAAIQIQKVTRGYLARVRVTRHQREAHRQQMAVVWIARNSSRSALLGWKLEQRGAMHVITRAMYPMLMREKFRRLIRLVRRQRAAKLIATNVFQWYRNSRHRHQVAHRESIAMKLQSLYEKENKRIQQAAVVIQQNVQKWWAQNQYQMTLSRKKKLAKRKRIQAKQDKLLQLNRKPQQQHKRILGGGGAAVGGLVSSVLKKKKHQQPADSEMESESDRMSRLATMIQCAFRRHVHHNHFLLVQYRSQACRVEEKLTHRRHAAIKIQKRIRGMAARRLIRRLRAEQHLIQWIRQWKWRRIQRITKAAKRITRWLKQKKTQRLAKLWRLEKEQQTKSASKIRKWLQNGFFYQKRIFMIRSRARKQEETKLFVAQSLVICKQHFMDLLILQSTQPNQYDESLKSYVQQLKGSCSGTNRQASDTDTVRKPPKKPRFPLLPLLFLVLSGLSTSTGRPWVPTLDDLDNFQDAKMERSKLIALFKAANKHAKSKHPVAHKKGEFFPMTEIDLAMAKAAGATKRPLGFHEFIHCLSSISDARLTNVTIWWSKYDGPESRLCALLWQFVSQIQEPSIQQIFQELGQYVTLIMDQSASIIQRIFIKKRNISSGRLLLLQQLHHKAIEQKKDAIVKLQAQIRRFLAQQIYKQRVQAQYQKYIDPQWQSPYWLNPKTGFTTWQKPFVLGDLDVSTEVVPYPSAEKVLSVLCQGKAECMENGICSDFFCFTCDEPFCGNCMEHFHQKKTKKNSNIIDNITTSGDNTSDAGEPDNEEPEREQHEMEPFLKCGLCEFQLASRKCLSCLDTLAHSKNAKQMEKIQEKEALFCDVCFDFVHQKGALQTHQFIALVELCTQCQDEDELLDLDNKTQEIRAKAVQWVCETHEKRICSHCALLKHPVELCGDKLQKTRILTIKMKERNDLVAKILADKLKNDKEYIKKQELQVKQLRAIKKIQTFWKNYSPVIQAKTILRGIQKQKGDKWHQFLQDQKIEKLKKYRFQQILGIAKPLKSDSNVQAKLKEMTFLQRKQILIRAKLFGLLVDEYMELGVPLPGIVKLNAHKRDVLHTCEDLRGWVLNRQTLRLKKLVPKGTNKKRRGAGGGAGGGAEEEKETQVGWPHELAKWRRDPSDTLLVDVDAKRAIGERSVPLVVTSKEKKGGEGDVEEEEEEEGDVEEYAAFLVEFSMDPTRVVWINHSFAERFEVWRKKKWRLYQERRRAAQRAKDAKEEAKEAQASGAGLKDEGEVDPQQQQQQPELPVESATVSLAEGETATAATSWDGYGYGYGYDASGYDYSGYDADAAIGYGDSTTAASAPYDYYTHGTIATATAAAMGTGGYTGYDASYYQPPASASPLVESGNYFYAEDANAAAWAAYYQAHPEDMAQAQAAQEATATGDEAAWGGYAGGYDAGYATDYYDPAAAAAAPAAASLSPWEEVFDPVTQRTYYYNRDTQQTSWEYPYASQ